MGGGGGGQFLSHYLTILDIKIIFSLVSNLRKILNLTSDPIIIRTLLCPFETFCFHFLTFAKHFLSNICKTQKCLLGCDGYKYTI